MKEHSDFVWHVLLLLLPFEVIQSKKVHVQLCHDFLSEIILNNPPMPPESGDWGSLCSCRSCVILRWIHLTRSWVGSYSSDPRQAGSHAQKVLTFSFEWLKKWSFCLFSAGVCCITGESFLIPFSHLYIHCRVCSVRYSAHSSHWPLYTGLEWHHFHTPSYSVNVGQTQKAWSSFLVLLQTNLVIAATFSVWDLSGFSCLLLAYRDTNLDTTVHTQGVKFHENPQKFENSCLYMKHNLRYFSGRERTAYTKDNISNVYCSGRESKRIAEKLEVWRDEELSILVTVGVGGNTIQVTGECAVLHFTLVLLLRSTTML